MINLDVMREVAAKADRACCDEDRLRPGSDLAVLLHNCGRFMRLMAREIEGLTEERDAIQLHWKACVRCHLTWRDPDNTIPCPRCNPTVPEAIVQIKRLEQAESLLRRLVEVDPMIEGESGEERCFFCGAGDCEDDPEPHLASCPYSIAVGWLGKR